jgi:DNA repair photolyase
MLNKQKGNMYPFVTHTWNPISGKCLHDCKYCYMKVWPQKELHLNEKALKDNLGKDRFIFVGSSTDMFADNVPRLWIDKVLQSCRIFDSNKYLFQTKNPDGLGNHGFPLNSLLAVTIESNRYDPNITYAPSVEQRALWLQYDSGYYPFMVSIEPVMDFDIDEFVKLLRLISPAKISIGADSQGHHLPEPSPEKLKELISACKEITDDIVLKDNLKRLLTDT